MRVESSRSTSSAQVLGQSCGQTEGAMSSGMTQFYHSTEQRAVGDYAGRSREATTDRATGSATGSNRRRTALQQERWPRDGFPARKAAGRDRTRPMAEAQAVAQPRNAPLRAVVYMVAA